MNPTKKKYTKVAHLIPEVMQLRAEGKSITQIGEVMGLTKQRISQISQAAKIKAEIQAQWG
jgi:DNA-directed RNA polymerase specialized sigma subunit